MRYAMRYAMRCDAIQNNTIQYNTIQYNTIQYNTIQNNTIQLVSFNAVSFFRKVLNLCRESVFLIVLFETW